ncbi:MAG: dephospho-CoA kinase [Pseudotabrizicola sp.]|uniref:dephospho-CoA kinase n=1 Tax=Pseudotabrizicola sp. TaxID=2939647 RepID=UPI002726ECD2|nr:dephospho-CoA kinase [Pseudotabrizicola sp.]MDO8883449.1 dephospho-CoA kinase [Pseudotabrizicola sp.]MDP2083409.1 dephospho-CoA kinase [Pseudotabrizicola sp.]MDZ7574947.1 dephospho-CoA kinase [Pseudotabrizicola sp.]
MTFLRLGLTGSIGMGKSTTAALFAAEDIPVWDADAAVHRLYAPGGLAVGVVADLCPVALDHGSIDRTILREWIKSDPSALPRLEAVVHPFVAADRAAFSDQQADGIVVFDIPLLFEKGTEAEMDATLLVTAPPAIQRQRVLSRPGMTAEQFALILSRQMPDAEKRARATHIVETLSIDQTRSYVQALIAHLRSGYA